MKSRQRQDAPFPAWSDAAGLLTPPFLLVGILLLPNRPLTTATRMRVALDGLMIMTAVATISWYFVLGPTVLQGTGTVFAKIVSSAYPLSDVVLLSCLLALFTYAEDRGLRGARRLLAVGLGIVVVTDTILDYLILHSAYATGGLLDLGWPLGYMLIGLAVPVMLSIPTQKTAESPAEVGRVTGVWRALLPYALIPVSGLFSEAGRALPFFCLGLAAAYALIIGQARSALRLAGAADAERRRLELVPESVTEDTPAHRFRLKWGRRWDAILDVIDENERAALWAAGHDLAVADASAVALELVTPIRPRP